MNKVSLKQLNEHLGDKKYALILGLGFDPRCLETIKAIPSDALSHIMGICNSSWVSLSEQNINDFKKYSGGRAVIVGDAKDSVIEITDKVSRHFETLTKTKGVNFII